MKLRARIAGRVGLALLSNHTALPVLGWIGLALIAPAGSEERRILATFAAQQLAQPRKPPP